VGRYFVPIVKPRSKDAVICMHVQSTVATSSMMKVQWRDLTGAFAMDSEKTSSVKVRSMHRRSAAPLESEVLIKDKTDMFNFSNATNELFSMDITTNTAMSLTEGEIRELVWSGPEGGNTSPWIYEHNVAPVTKSYSR
jgi:hypothetical protein